MSILPITTDEYTLLRDAYTGGGGFDNGDYLFQHSREDMADFMVRKKMARYSNFVKVIVKALTNPIFKKTIVRDFEENDMLKKFVEDVDGQQTSLNAFMKKATKWARLYGRVFIIVDNYAAEEQALNRADALNMRRFPYLYVVCPDQITDYETDRTGRFVKLSYKLRVKRSKGDMTGIGDMEEWTWTQTGWECKNGDKVEKVREGLHGLGEIPVVALSAVDEDTNAPLPVPDMLHIAKANRDIFNRDSEKREILRNQCFPVLVYPATRQSANELKQTDEEGNPLGLTVGTGNMLVVDASAGVLPNFIAPPLEPVQTLQQEIKDIVDDMYRQAGLTSVVGVETKASGVAKQWDFEETTNHLADMAENCELAEVQIFNLFAKWAGIEIKELKIKYPRTFNITDIEDELAKAQQMKDLAVGGEVVAREINRKAAEVYFADVDDKRYDEIMADIEEAADKSQHTQSEE